MSRPKPPLATLAAVVLAVITLGACSSGSTGHSAAPVSSPVVVDGFHSALSIVSQSVQGTTGWVLTSGEDAGIWRVPARGAPKKVVDRSGFDGLDLGGVTIVAFGGKVVLLGQRCVMDKVAGAECVTSTGVAEFFDSAGALTHTTMLWKNQVAQAGGSAPNLLSVNESAMWLAGADKLYSVNTTGNVTETVPREKNLMPCASGNQLYATNWIAPAGPDESSEAGSRKDDGSFGSSRVSLAEWTHHTWTGITGSLTTAGGANPEVTCGTEGIMVWDAGKLAANWQPGKGWTTISTTNALGRPAKSSEGVGYLVAPSGELQRQNPHTGALVGLGLTLRYGSGNTKRVDQLRVAERGRSVFACGIVSTGTTATPTAKSTRCGFTTTGS